jgi:hypothetical protein
MDLLSWKRALELLFDLNLGLLPYVPVALLLFCAAALGALLQPRRGAVALARMTLVLAMALASSVTVNWNHGTAGPSRYTIWMLPLIFTGAVEALSACGLSIGAWRGSLASSLAGLAVASQFAVVMARGGLRQPPDYLAHSYAARWVLHYAPRLYNPSPEIFVARTTNSTEPATGPVVYRDDWGCRKALARRRDAAAVTALCGRLPPGSEEFFSRIGRRKDRAYVNW